MRLPAWHAHIDVWLLFGSIVAAYAIAIRRHDRTTGEVTDRRRRHLFFGGMAVMWLGADWPVHDLAEGYLYSMHMVQHMLFFLVATPMLVAGMPAWMWRQILRPRPLRQVWSVVTRPLVALLTFNAVLLFTHWPAVVEASVRSGMTHFALHALLVGSAAAMWWPILSPLPEMPALRPPGQMMYLFLQSLAPTVPASFLTFGTSPLYPIYATFPRIWGIGVLTDQQIAGLVMKLAGGMILWVEIGVVFFRWYERERTEGWDELKWQNVEQEIRSEMGR